VPRFRIIDYTDSTYPIVRSASYVQPGDTMPAATVGIVDATGGPTRWVDVPGDPRNNYVEALDWAPTSDALLVVQLNRLQDTARVFSTDPATGGVRRIFLDGDDTWVEPRPIHWLEGGRSFTWVSERDGWRHVYRVSRDGGEVRLLTPGDFDILTVEAVDRKAGWLYFIASPDNPTQRYLYRSRLDGGGRVERVTPKDLPGTNAYDVAPGAGWAWHTRSRLGSPPVTDLVSLPDHRSVRTVVTNEGLRHEVTGLRRGAEDFFRVDIGGGVALDGWVMKPYDFDPTRKYPVLFYVYGMPAAQTVLDQWGGNQYLFHVLLTQLGYVVMSVDNRGTPAPRGRDWRKIIYLKHGVLPARDQAAAVRALEARWSWMDSSHIGIYGWSGGGNVSMNAIFRHPDVYSLAMPGAGLSSHRFYHASFTERFMGLPQDHPDAYEATAPINVAKNLRGHLLIIQGTGDSNVHFKSSAALENALIAAGKRFTIMPYPNRNHGMREGENTQWHLHDLYVWYLQQNMPSERNHETPTWPPSENPRHEP
jgi:dipeptidyl-peptidase-4